MKRGNVGRCNERGRQVYFTPRLYTRSTTRYQFLSEVQLAHVGITVGNKPPVSVQLIRSAIPPRGDHGIGYKRAEQGKRRESVRHASIVGLEYYEVTGAYYLQSLHKFLCLPPLRPCLLISVKSAWSSRVAPPLITSMHKAKTLGFDAYAGPRGNYHPSYTLWRHDSSRALSILRKLR